MPPYNPSPSFSVVNFPSPNLADKVLVEQYDHTLARFGPANRYTTVPAYGTAHPTQEGMRLVHVKVVEPERIYHWYWVNDRASEDAYNYELSYPDGDITYPLVKRTYLIRRSEYAPIAEGTADSAFAGCVLTRQRTVRTSDPVFDSLYVVVERWYEKVPGKANVSEEEDVEHRVIIYTHRQMIADATLPPTNQLSSTALGATYANGKKLEWNASDWTTGVGYVIGAKKDPIEDSDAYVMRTVQYCALPPVRYDYPSRAFTFPAIYNILEDGEWINVDGTYQTKHPWAGVDFTFTPHRSIQRPTKDTYTYFLEGSPPAVPALWRVVTPAAASRFLPIPENTIHPASTIIEFGDDIETAIVETYPASTPSSYNENDVLLIACEDLNWRGRIKMRRETRISESRSPYTF